jgi:hypoxanthine phosphoribosyltransferase
MRPAGLLGSRPMEIASVLFGREEIRRRVQELGRTITGDYVGRDPVFITVLRGGAIFLADLVRAVDLPLQTHFLAITRYGGAETSFGRVRVLLDVDVDLDGRDVILVEDIVDTGLTVAYLLSVLRVRGAASVEVCTLLDRSVRRIAPLQPRYVGFDCPDRFVVGYGMDFRDRFRNLPDILCVDDMDELKRDPGALDGLLARV